MKPLIVLLATFAIAVFAIKIITQNYELALSARIAMSAMLLFTSIGHFKYTKGMAMMIPGAIPYKTGIIYGTGILEILGAIGLQIPGLQIVTAWLLILFFVLLLPANVNAAVKRINFEKGNFEGSGTNYLWFRVPLQILFIVWLYLSAIQFP